MGVGVRFTLFPFFTVAGMESILNLNINLSLHHCKLCFWYVEIANLVSLINQ